MKHGEGYIQGMQETACTSVFQQVFKKRSHPMAACSHSTEKLPSAVSFIYS